MFDHLVLLEAELLTGAFKVNFQEVHHLSANMATFCEICCFTQVPEVFVDSHRLPGDSPATPRRLPRRPPTQSFGDKETRENQCV